jgi:hypothetical protein
MARRARPSLKQNTALGSPSQGVMVSPGRYVNLSGAPPTLEQCLRQHFDRAMRVAKFTRDVLLCENLLLEATLSARQYQDHPHHSYRGKKVTRISFGTSRPKGRNQEQIRLYWMSVIWRVWMRGTRTMPVINNRKNPDTPFVIFAKTVSAWFGMGNLVKNLERYQSYRRSSLAGNSYLAWTKGVRREHTICK